MDTFLWIDMMSVTRKTKSALRVFLSFRSLFVLAQCELLLCGKPHSFGKCCCCVVWRWWRMIVTGCQGFPTVPVAVIWETGNYYLVLCGAVWCGVRKEASSLDGFGFVFLKEAIKWGYHSSYTFYLCNLLFFSFLKKNWNSTHLCNSVNLAYDKHCMVMWNPYLCSYHVLLLQQPDLMVFNV